MTPQEYDDKILYLKSKKIAIGWLENLDLTNHQAIAIARNLTDQSALEYSFYFGIPSYYGKTVDDLLEQAKNHDWLVILATGNIVYSFFHELAEQIDSFANTAIVGHILDKGDQYYKVYPQAMVINLKWFKDYNCPAFGIASNEIWQTTRPLRSEENFHGEYTPIWVKQGTELVTYNGKLEGWNIFKVALESGYEVKSFNEKMRNSKKYFYPEDTDDWPFQLTKLLTIAKSNKHFLNNTESKLVCPKELYGTFDTCIFTAAGLNTILMPWLLGMPKGSNVVVYDITYSALTTAANMHQFYKGGSINEFWHDHCLPANRSSLYYDDFFHSFDIDKVQASVNDELVKGLDVWITDILPTLNYKFVYVDIFNRDTWHLLKVNNNRVFLSLSNILHYIPTSIHLSLKDKVIIATEFFNEIKSLGNEWVIDYRGFENINRELTNLTDVSNLRIPQALKFLPWNN